VSARVRVAVLYGGRSSEHEISLQSAKCVLDNLDPARFDVLPIAIDRGGAWHVQDLARLRASHDKALPVDAGGDEVRLRPSDGGALVQGAAAAPIDVVFPIMHGPLCEDGSMQGLLELADVAYVGPGVLGSAIGMDKDVAKRLAQAAGIPIVDYVCVRAAQWPALAPQVRARIGAELGYPVFVKPANLGSSVGVTKVASEAALDAAVQGALAYDTKVLIERAIDAREIELAVLSSLDEHAPPEVSVAGEIVPRAGDFYSYESKYLDPNGAALHIPAPIGAEQAAEAARIAREAFVALECHGMARVDLFLDRATGRLLFNEVNTIPGFTTISMYPKLWEASGLPYRDLLARLIDLALQRRAHQHALKRER
jgi:D-alanine-D-alanine ligase